MLLTVLSSCLMYRDGCMHVEPIMTSLLYKQEESIIIGVSIIEASLG